MKKDRLYFLDAVRAFAILMMLQGHFIDGLLNPVYRSDSYMIYNIWSDLRGNTAPIFFSVSGLVVMYLLLIAQSKDKELFRIQKSLKRGLSLILIGYALRIPYLQWLIGSFNSYFLVIDVLQIIGLSLIILNAIYYFLKSKPTLLTMTLGILGLSIFLTEPYYRNLSLPHVPEIFANYFTKENGSIFTIFPWFGYVSFGALIGMIFFKFQSKNYFKPIAISLFLILGMSLSYLSSPLLLKIHELTGIKLILDVANFNYLFSRLGVVLNVFGIFYTLENYLKHPLISKLGNNTLSIYIVHFIILYGSFIGIGLYRFLHNALDPWPAAIGAFLFVYCVCIIVLNEDKIKTIANITTRKAFVTLKLNTINLIRLNRR